MLDWKIRLLALLDRQVMCLQFVVYCFFSKNSMPFFKLFGSRNGTGDNKGCVQVIREMFAHLLIAVLSNSSR